MTLRIRNWRQFQQYKDRCPPWIKLHREILQSADWVMWNTESRLLAVVCMLLASRTDDGSLPNDPNYIRRAAYLPKRPNLQPLIACGFLELDGDDSKAYTTLASCTTEESREEERRDRGEGEKRARFTPPTVDEVRAHVAEKGFTFDPETFHAYYESQGWKKANGRKVESWKGCCVTFQKREPAGKSQVGEASADGNDGPWFPEVAYWPHGWHPDDDKHKGHLLFQAWVDECTAKYGERGDARWPRFEAWKERGDE